MRERDTKELILEQALALFARQGFAAVSMRQLAGQLGLSVSALYKHYRGKRDIFDALLQRMAAQDASQAQAYAMPEQTFSQQAAPYRHTALSALKDYSFAQFRYWTEDAFASDFRRLLTLEQYRSPEMTALYRQYLSGGVVDYLTDVFRELPEALPGRDDPRQLALAFYGPLYLLISCYDAAPDPPSVTAQALAHIRRFPG